MLAAKALALTVSQTFATRVFMSSLHAVLG